MAEEIYPVRKNDPGYRPDHTDEWQRNSGPGRTRDKDKGHFIWSLGEAAVTEMTRTDSQNDPKKTVINQLYSLFRLHFIPKRNKFHSRDDFFWYHPGTKRNSRGRMDENTANRENLRV